MFEIYLNGESSIGDGYKGGLTPLLEAQSLKPESVKNNCRGELEKCWHSWGLAPHMRLGFRIQGSRTLGCRAWGMWLWVEGLEFRASNRMALWFRVWGLILEIQNTWLWNGLLGKASGVWVGGSGLRVGFSGCCFQHASCATENPMT